MPALRTYYVVETRGDRGNSDTLAQTEHEIGAEARVLAKRVGGRVFRVKSTIDAADRIVRIYTEVRR